ncbi:hypothetical protein HNR72_003773 [Streptomyces collinus]|uniref:Uncharacterized protein n=1 Tax=Streptomyces collinus TaxID=42684 RepID=A0AA89Q4T0_STRCU|nr:hypothetical protein [Streptomyces collinus]
MPQPCPTRRETAANTGKPDEPDKPTAPTKCPGQEPSPTHTRGRWGWDPRRRRCYGGSQDHRLGSSDALATKSANWSL